MKSDEKHGRADVLELLPHGESWALVDRIVRIEPPDFIVTEKLVDPMDPILRAHFRAGPAVYPGVLLIEYVGQSAYLLTCATADLDGARPVHFLTRCSATFLSPARPGDLLSATVRRTEMVGDVSVFEATVACITREVCRVRLFSKPVVTE